MAAVVMDGKALAARIKEQVRLRVERMAQKPGLAVVLVGEDPAALAYESGKRKDCQACGVYYDTFRLPESASQEDLLGVIGVLNGRADIDGVLLLLPLPRHLNQREAILAVRPDKDVDCVSPVNLGKLLLDSEEAFLPCTPAGVMRLLEEYGVDPAGKECVVVGRSHVVGKPQALLLLRKNGTVTVCHSKTADLAGQCRRADILVSAAGRPGLITADMVKPGAAVIDVSMNRDAQGKLCGDVDCAAAERAAFLTPVPGGTGPVTRAVLMENVLAAALAHGKR